MKVDALEIGLSAVIQGRIKSKSYTVKFFDSKKYQKLLTKQVICCWMLEMCTSPKGLPGKWHRPLLSLYHGASIVYLKFCNLTITST